MTSKEGEEEEEEDEGDYSYVITPLKIMSFASFSSSQASRSLFLLIEEVFSSPKAVEESRRYDYTATDALQLRGEN